MGLRLQRLHGRAASLMPQASPALRSRWDDARALEFLRSAGWTVCAGFNFHKPAPDHATTADEADAIEYLQAEWDYGVIVT